MNRRDFVLAAVAAASTAGLSGPARAAWPERAITWVVPFPPGGPMDLVSRPVAKKMSEYLGVPVVVENKSGAGGALGMEAVARSKPDGYTIGIASIGTQAIVPNVNPSARYDPNASFSNIGLLGQYVNVLIVSASSPVRSVQDLLALGAAKGAAVTFGSAGNGSSNHLSAELLKTVARVPFTHVPYRGSAPALTDLLGGNITFMFDTLNTTMPRFENGTLRALAVTSPKRSRFLPDVPTMDEAGVKGYANAGSELWWGVVGAAGMPADVQQRLNDALVRALKSDEIQDQFRRQYVEAWPSTPAEFSRVVRESHERWGKVIREAGIKDN